MEEYSSETSPLTILDKFVYEIGNQNLYRNLSNEEGLKMLSIKPEKSILPE